eukprot:TRINITY_DN11470_c0_g1_i7.p1 TRINITY_DN11470_c0_g1~~TRINITY_DN11470_c0_g1_i7.p1  ORF type:complete len:134 (+),score=20.41 TRINITY_DN11470_c0_g1_i7:283-684(+)
MTSPEQFINCNVLVKFLSSSKLVINSDGVTSSEGGSSCLGKLALAAAMLNVGTGAEHTLQQNARKGFLDRSCAWSRASQSNVGHLSQIMLDNLMLPSRSVEALTRKTALICLKTEMILVYLSDPLRLMSSWYK